MIFYVHILQGSFTYVAVEQDDVTVKLTVGDRAVYGERPRAVRWKAFEEGLGCTETITF